MRWKADEAENGERSVEEDVLDFKDSGAKHMHHSVKVSTPRLV